jgi:4,5-DOPA dioxygenase extradiol
MTIDSLKQAARQFPDAARMPALFVGHGSPMNAIEDSDYSRAWESLGKSLPRPNAVLCVSAHWLTEGTFVHAAEKPRTIHDFWGFPQELYDVRYPCLGSPQRAEETRGLVLSTKVSSDLDWGIDHGTWSVLRRMYPNADVPVFQLSLDMAKTSAAHYAIGEELAALRDRGVLIVGSGNIVHNLGMIDFEETARAFPWAVEFDAAAKLLIEKGDHKALTTYEKLGHAAMLSIPAPDHYWPLLYTLAAAAKDDRITFPVEGISNASISMRTVLIGGK